MLFVLTGAPGSGKTTVLTELARRGRDTVAEAATDVIARSSNGRPEADPAFIRDVVRLQLAREGAAPNGAFLDRSLLCTLALAWYLDHPAPVELAHALEHTVVQKPYGSRVFFFESLPLITTTPARQISLSEALRFGALHVRAYEKYGFELVRVPVAPPSERADQILTAVGGRG